MKKLSHLNKLASALALGSALFLCQGALAAQGEMGAGTPHFGMYSAATGTQIRVWSLASATIAFPAGCSSLNLTPATMGLDTYKLAIATMLTAKATGKRVRFYAHAPRDGGCGVDYVELQD